MKFYSVGAESEALRRGIKITPFTRQTFSHRACNDTCADIIFVFRQLVNSPVTYSAVSNDTARKGKLGFRFEVIANVCRVFHVGTSKRTLNASDTCQLIWIIAGETETQRRENDSRVRLPREKSSRSPSLVVELHTWTRSIICSVIRTLVSSFSHWRIYNII